MNLWDDFDNRHVLSPPFVTSDGFPSVNNGYPDPLPTVHFPCPYLISFEKLSSEVWMISLDCISPKSRSSLSITPPHFTK